MEQERPVWSHELRAMVALAVPVVLSELGWMAMGVVDTIMVGRLGPAAIGAVALGNAICYTPSIFGVGLMLGLDTLVSQAYGREDHDECHRWLAQGVYLACLAAVPIMVGIWLASLGFTHFGIAAEVAVPASGYLRLLNWGTLPLLLYGATRRYLQGVGQVRVITLTYVLANLVNWFGNWVLIYGKLGFPALGVNGSAISTAISRVIMAAALLGFAWRYERSRGHPLFRHWAAPQVARLKGLLQLGAPAAGQILIEVGAWNLATFLGRLPDAGGPRDAPDRAQLRERNVHGAIGNLRRRRGQRGPGGGRKRWGACAARGMDGAGLGNGLHAPGGVRVFRVAAPAYRVVLERSARAGRGAGAAGHCRVL